MRSMSDYDFGYLDGKAQRASGGVWPNLSKESVDYSRGFIDAYLTSFKKM